MRAVKDAVSVLLLLLLLLLMVLCRYRTCGKNQKHPLLHVRCINFLCRTVRASCTGCSGRARRSSDIPGHQHYQQQLACDFNELP